MDYLKKAVGGGDDSHKAEPEKESGGFMDKLNSMAGGGKEAEAKEDYLDKGHDSRIPPRRRIDPALC